MSTFSVGLLPLLLLAFLAYVLWRVLRSRPTTPTQATQLNQPPESKAIITWPARDEYEFEVVGEAYYQPALQALAGNHGEHGSELLTTAVLVPDDGNQYDNKAVKVLIDGHNVGHLGREDARSYRRRLAAKKHGMVPAQCGALIMGGFVGQDGKRASYGVRLDLKPFE